MTNQEEYDMICKVCDEIRASLSRESNRIKEVAKQYENNHFMRSDLEFKAIHMIEAKICVSAVEMKMTWDVIKKATEDDNVIINREK